MLLMHTAVVSDNITHVSWRDNTLFIRFKKTGAVYQYPGQPLSAYSDLVSAESVGKRFHATLKSASCSQLKDEALEAYMTLTGQA